MKLRRITCIHVAAYLFSALVLGASAVSYYYICMWDWTADHSEFKIISLSGKMVLHHVGQAETEKEDLFFDFGELEPGLSYYWDPLNHEMTDWNQATVLGLKFYGTNQSGGGRYPNRLYVVPYSSLLIPSLAWMCGFHLFRLRRRWRSERYIQPMPVSEGASSE